MIRPISLFLAVLLFSSFILIPSASAKLGDIDNNGLIDQPDIIAVKDHLLERNILTGEQLDMADYDSSYDNGVQLDDLFEITEVVKTNVIIINLPGGETLEMLRMPRGFFTRGRGRHEFTGAPELDSSPEEDPNHLVNIGQEFYFGRYEVTKAQWEAVMGTRPWEGESLVSTHPDSPAVYISWNDAQDFITALNQTGQGIFRLPSEAEWEYACRAGTQTRFYWGDDLEYENVHMYAWFKDNADYADESYAHVVGQKLPNAWGLYDMCGNVAEWCQCYYHPNYYGAPKNQDWWEAVMPNRVLRNGGFLSGMSDYPYYSFDLRSASRGYGDEDFKCASGGFRLARQRWN